MKQLINVVQRLAWVVGLMGSLALFIQIAPSLGFAENAWVLWFYTPHVVGAAIFFGEVTDWALFSHAKDEPVLEVVFELAQRLVWLAIWIIAMFWMMIQLFNLIGGWALAVWIFVWLASGFAAFGCAEATSWAIHILAEVL